MASSAASRFFSYHRLGKDDTSPLPLPPHQPTPFHDPISPAARHLPFNPRWMRLRRSIATTHRSWWRPRRPRVRVAGLRRLLGRKARLLRAAVTKVVQRFKEGKAHFGDLFAGNYMFLQVNPTTAASASKASAYIQPQQRSMTAAAGDARLQGRQFTTPPVAKYYIPYRVAA